MAYLIVDEAIVDLPMERDPFEAVGLPIPSELPYNDDKVSMALNIELLMSALSMTPEAPLNDQSSEAKM